MKNLDILHLQPKSCPPRSGALNLGNSPLKKISNLLVFCSLLLLSLWPAAVHAQTQSEIVAENLKAGTDQVNWDYDYRTSEGRILGFATDMSTNKGGTVKFKIRCRADAYKVEIFRIGYYQGKGARKVGDATIVTPLPFVQPLNTVNTETGLIECSNWTVNAEWKIPADAVSGVYIAKLTITDNIDPGVSNQAIFVVRDDASRSDLYFKTSDATWQAYNDFGEYSTAGANLYYGRYTSGSPLQGQTLTKYPNGRAVKVSYDRPFANRAPDGLKSFFFSAEFAMVRWLERNGYSVSYFTDVDAERNGALIKNHKTFVSVGHDEYWSATERANVEAARDAGVNLAFFSGNEVYWKTRWEPGLAK
jgi:hypothetical protein